MTKQLFLVGLVIIFTIASLKSQVTFQKTYGGSFDEEACCVQQATDLGYIMCGYSKSFNNNTSKDAYICKTDVNGNVQWSKTYGGAADEQLQYIIQTSDGGYLAVGYSTNCLNSASGLDIYVLKVDAAGVIQWTKCFGDNYGDIAYSVTQTIDGNYVVGGYVLRGGSTSSYADYYIMKLDVSGNVLWTKAFGDNTTQDIAELKELSNGDLIFVGSSNYSGGITASGGAHDAVIFKTDSNGNLLQTFETGGSTNDGLRAITIAGNGDIIVGGNSWETVNSTAYYTRVNAAMTNYSWISLVGKPSNDLRTWSIQLASGGNFITAMAYVAVNTTNDGHLMLLNGNGGLVWTKTYGGSNSDEFKMANQANDGGFYAAGYSTSYGAGGKDIYLIKTDANGDIANLTCPVITFTPTLVSPTFAVANVTLPVRDNTYLNANGSLVSSAASVTVSPTTCTVITCTPIINAPDTVCVNQKFNVTNTCTNANTYYWNFCSGNVNTTPIATNLGGFGGVFSSPVYTSIQQDGGKYYMFVSNNASPSIIRLDYGASLLNTPTVTNLGNISSALPNNPEGIYIQKEGNNWYGLVVGGQGGQDRIVKLNFGNSLANVPTATNMGNIGTLGYPKQLVVFQSGGNYYGLTINTVGNTITRFDFGNSINNTPTGTNLGNLGGLNQPGGISLINYQNNWYGYIVNQTGPSYTRLDFGNSLLNTPTGTNLGNPGGVSNLCAISVFTECGGISGLVSEYGSHRIGNISFPNGPTGPIVTSMIGNIAGFNFPHSIERIRVKDTLFVFVPNAWNNTLSRLAYVSCNNSSISSSTLQTPPPLSYNKPGVYDITLATDETLITASSACKQVVVVGTPTLNVVSSKSICTGSSATLTASGASSYSWSPTVGLSSTISATVTATPNTTTTYTVIGKNNTGCADTATILVTVTSCTTTTTGSLVACYPFNNNTNDMSGYNNNGTRYSSTFTTDRFGNPNSSGNFDGVDDSVNVGKNSSLKMTNAVSISAWFKLTTFSPTNNPNYPNGPFYQNIISDHAPNETTVGAGKILRIYNNTVQFVVGGVVGQGSGQFAQSPPISLNQWIHVVGTYDRNTTKLYVNGVLVDSKPYSQPIVANSNELLIGKSGFGEYFNGSLDDIQIYSTALSSSDVTNLYNGGGQCCSAPVVTVTTNSNSVCSGNSTTLTASGATSYTWNPSIGLNTTTSATVTATPTVTTTYTVTGTNACGASSSTLMVTVNACPTATTSCLGGSLLINNTNASVHLPPNQNYINPGGFTWECWFKLNSSNVPNQKARIFINASDLTIGEDITFGIGWTNSATMDYLVFNVDPPSNSGSTVNYAVSYKPSGGFVQNVWYHAAGVMDYTNFTSKLYLNGQLVGTFNQPLFKPLNATTRNSSNWPAPVSVGWDAAIGGSLPSANANVDEIRIWNRVRTDAEVLANYNQCLAGNEPNLITYYRCNQSSGTTAIDGTPNNNNGTLVNNASWSNQEPVYAGSNCGSTNLNISVNSATICAGSTATLTASSGANLYSWSPSNGLSSATSATVTATPSTTVTYSVTGVNACGTSVATSTITVLQAPNVSVNSASICQGQTATLTANGAATYTWSPVTNLSNSVTATVSASPVASLAYVVTGQGVNGCKSQATANVIVNPLPSAISVNSAAYCIGSSAKLSAKGASSYTWSPAASLNSTTSATVTASPQITTTYTVTSGTACGVVSATSTVTVYPLPSAIVSGGTGCQSNRAMFTGLNGAPAYKFVYQINGGAKSYVLTDKSSNSTYFTLLNGPNGLYTCSLVSVTDVHNCSSNVSGQYTTLNIAPKPNAVFSVDPQQTNLFKSAISISDISLGGSSWMWDFGDGTTEISSNPQSHSYADTGTYKIKLVLTNGVGCKDSSFQYVNIKPPFVLYIPNTFTPNGDGNNDIFNAKGEFILKYEMNIYDRWGNNIFYTDDLNKGWDGKVKGGKEVAEIGSYVYVIDVKAMSNKHDYTYRGYFNLVR